MTYCDEKGKQIKFAYSTMRMGSGWFCDRCGERLMADWGPSKTSAGRKPKWLKCGYCHNKTTYHIEYRPYRR